MNFISYSLILLICTKASAQTCDTVSFQNFYWIKGLDGFSIVKAVTDSAGNNFIIGTRPFTTIASTGAPDVDLILIKTNKRGTPFWTKVFGTNRSDFINDMVLAKDGGVILVGMTQAYSAGEAWILKINADGNLLWSKGNGMASSSFFKATVLNDGGVAVAGTIDHNYTLDNLGNVTSSGPPHAITAVLNSDGSLRWYKEFYGPGNWESGWNIIQTKDSSLIINGSSYLRPGNNSTYYCYLLKLNASTGEELWGKLINAGVNEMRELSNRNIRCYNGKSMLEIDEDGNLQWAKNINFDVNINYMHPIINSSMPDDEDVFIANSYSGTIPYFISLKNMFLDGPVYTYKNVNNVGQFSYVSGDCYNGQYTLYGSIITHKFSSDKNVEYQPYLIETDSKGFTPCTEENDLHIDVRTNNVSSFGASFTYHDGNMSLVGGVASRNIIINFTRDCYKTTCCRDTILSSDVTLCYGNHYSLPDGRIIDTAGIYASYFKTNRGCDSIIYTDVSLKQPLKISLGNDTCFAESNAITFSLPYAANNVHYHWQNGNTDSFFVAKQPGLYWVKASDSCMASSDSVVILQNCLQPLYIPTAFTPNGDGKNDVFKIGDMKGQLLIQFSIYNRYGEKVFSTSNPLKGWDGNYNGANQSSGSYVYIITVKNFKGIKQFVKGSFVLIR